LPTTFLENHGAKGKVRKNVKEDRCEEVDMRRKDWKRLEKSEKCDLREI
jgi:hypothetical protein